MRLPIIKYNLLFGFILSGIISGLFCVTSVSAEMSPRDGYVKTPTGAPLAGVTITEFSDWCPPQSQVNQMMPGCPYPPPSCHSERSVRTDASGYYYFPVGIQPFNPNDPCNMNVWWRYTCSNPQVFYKISINSSQTANAIITPARADGDNICPPPIQHPTSNTPAVITTPISCPPPAACNTLCQSQGQCQYAQDGCTACVEGTCKIPPACGTACQRDGQCDGARNGCTMCIGGSCKPPSACNVSCNEDIDCSRATDGCTSCLPADSGTGKVCRKTPACNVACTKNEQCAGARDGCTACVNGSCRIPPACGTACTTKADCSGARENCSECLEGTCTNYNDQMCKCDGMTADMVYPGNSFKFEAFGKVEGGDIKKAEIADVTFRMTKDNQVVAKSDPIKPSIVENTAGKVRFKAAWSTPPPPISKNSTYRVFADVRCKPKKIVASNNQTSSTEPKAIADQKLYPPKGLEWIVKTLAGWFSGGKINPFVTEVLAQLASPSPSPSGAQRNLQLQTLNFVKLMDTDNCRFVMFKFDETLF